MNYSGIFLLILSIGIASCNEKVKPMKIDTSKFIKIWHDTIQGYPYQSELKIKQNYTFEYFSGACSYRSISEGTWEVKDDTLILNSIPARDCFYLIEFGNLCKTKEEIEKKWARKKNIVDCEASPEIEYEIFNNEVFYLKSDTLVHKKQNKECAGIDFAFSSQLKKD